MITTTLQSQAAAADAAHSHVIGMQGQSMIPKSGDRFSEKIMLKQ
jgi:hypothetical protein